MIDPNEGPLSLSRAFYYAGAKNVINSLWQIDDAATAEIFRDFYRRYHFGISGKALHEAKLEFIKIHLGKNLSPYYWAGLTDTGLDGESGNKNHYFFPVLILLSVFFPLTMLWLYLRNRRLRFGAH